jgi:uncharacterized protein with PIN domain
MMTVVSLREFLDRQDRPVVTCQRCQGLYWEGFERSHMCVLIPRPEYL